MTMIDSYELVLAPLKEIVHVLFLELHMVPELLPVIGSNDENGILVNTLALQVIEEQRELSIEKRKFPVVRGYLVALEDSELLGIQPLSVNEVPALMSFVRGCAVQGGEKGVVRGWGRVGTCTSIKCR
jgi:hypothetical protein